MKRIGILVMAALAVFTFALSLATKAAAQDAEPMQLLDVHYPDTGIVLSGKGDDAVTLRGTVHVQAFPLSPEVIKKHRNDALASEDVTIGSFLRFRLPLGKYELHFSTRDGNETRTTIETVVLRADTGSNVQIDFSTAKTYVIGDSIAFQQMEGYLVEMAKRVAALQAEVDALEGKTQAVNPATGPTDTPTK